jgi:hypothetical protein
MRDKITMDHNLGTHGYIGKKKVLALEDTTASKVGKHAPLAYLGEGCKNDFVRTQSQSI